MLRFTVAIAALAAAAAGQVPVFDQPVALEAGGVPISVGYGGNASPFVVDWDGDGARDLLLGQFDLGKVRFYRNVGINYDPAFTDFGCLRADGADISLSFG